MVSSLLQHVLLLQLLCMRVVYGAVGNSERYFNATFLQQDDISQERRALEDLYNYTAGASWQAGQAPGTQAWLQAGVSYCRCATLTFSKGINMHGSCHSWCPAAQKHSQPQHTEARIPHRCSWTGVYCCNGSPLQHNNCTIAHQVVALDLSGFGLSGSLPPSLGQLSVLAVLSLADNPSLIGPLPASWQLPQLLLLNTLVSLPAGPCLCHCTPCNTLPVMCHACCCLPHFTKLLLQLPYSAPHAPHCFTASTIACCAEYKPGSMHRHRVELRLQQQHLPHEQRPTKHQRLPAACMAVLHPHQHQPGSSLP
jgi:hypothetical protein